MGKRYKIKSQPGTVTFKRNVGDKKCATTACLLVAARWWWCGMLECV